MAAEDLDEFGEFTSFETTFPVDGNGPAEVPIAGTAHGGEGSNGSGTAKVDFFATFPTSGADQQPSCPADLPGWNACPIDINTGEGIPSITDFPSFGDMNITEFPIPNPGEVLNIDDIMPPLPPLNPNPSTGGGDATDQVSSTRNKQPAGSTDENAFDNFEAFSLQDSATLDAPFPLQFPVSSFPSSDPSSAGISSTVDDREHHNGTTEASGFADFVSFNSFPATTSQPQPPPNDSSPYVVAMVPTSPPPLDDFGGFDGFELDDSAAPDTSKAAKEGDSGSSTASKRTDSSLVATTTAEVLTIPNVDDGPQGKDEDSSGALKHIDDAMENSQAASVTTNTSFQPLASALDDSKLGPLSDDGQFGEFSGTFEENLKTVADDFGEFAGSNTGTVADEFSGFSSSKDNEFGAFSDSNQDKFPALTKPKNDTFDTSWQSGFDAFSNSTKDDFGDFTNSDFSSSAGTAFGSFSSATPTLPQPVQTTSTAVTAQPIAKDISKGSGQVLASCFPSGDGSKACGLSHHSASLMQQSLATQLSSQHATDTQEQSAWLGLQRCIDFTVPLYKWGQSYLQEHYYEAIQIDPLLVTKQGALPIPSSEMFEAPLGGATAAEDMMEAFGFESGIEAASRDPSSPMTSREFGLNPDAAPALLDLSLPTSPTEADDKNAITLDSDLLSLDLNPESNTQQLTSKQQLLLNERMVVSRSTWMDSELLQLGDPGSERQQQQPRSSSSSPPLPPTSSRSSSSSLAGKRQHTVEQQLLQLGLDVSKTTLAAGKEESVELSLSARSVLGRLPDLSFMLSESLVQSHYSGSM